MNKIIKEIFHLIKINFDILYIIFIFILINIILVYSSSQKSIYILKKNLLNILISFIIFFYIIYKKNNINIYKYAEIIYIINVLLLILVNIKGNKIKGAKRWLNIKFFKIQPSEFLKISLPIIISKHFSNSKKTNIFNFLKLILFIIIPTLLIFMQPDLGTAIFTIINGILTLYLCNLEFKNFIYICLFFIFSVIFSYFNLRKYQKNRIISLFSKKKDVLGIDYNIMQSKIAIGSGGFWGKGIFNGTQSRLNFIPESYTDFIFSVLSEELGFIGAFSIITLYFILINKFLSYFYKIKSNFFKIIYLSIILNIVLSILINIYMVLGIIPVVGTTLPFISYGGSSLLSFFICVSILLYIKNFNNYRY